MTFEEELAVADKALRDSYPEYFALIDAREILLEELRWLYECAVDAQSVAYCLKLMVTLNSHHTGLNLPFMRNVGKRLEEDLKSIDLARSLVLHNNPHYYAQIDSFPEVYSLVVKFSQAGCQEMLKKGASRYGQYFFKNMIQPYLNEYQKKAVAENEHAFRVPTVVPFRR